MRGQDEKSAPADGIGDSTIHLGLGRGEVGDRAAVLEVLGVAEEYNALDLVLDGGGELADGIGHNRSALRVATGKDVRVGALSIRHGKETLGLVDRLARSTGGEEVLGETGGVGASNSLGPYRVEAAVETVRHARTGRETLRK